MSMNMPKICVSKCASMLLLVVQCTLHLLVMTRCSLVIDVRNQDAGKNIYCTKSGAAYCKPGTNVLCMYNETKLGPRCDQGELIELKFPEREFLRHIFNGFKRAVSKGEEVLGKNEEVLPRGKNLLLLQWNPIMAQGAQAWANQCNPKENDYCHNFAFTPTTVSGQLIDIIRFGHPDWSYPGQHFLSDDSKQPNLERIRVAITEFARNIYAERKMVTAKIIRNNTRELKSNSYLQAVLGNSRRIGCGMAKFVDYMVGNKEDPDTYNAIIIVCNFSHKPLIGQKVYDVIDPHIFGVTRDPDFDWCDTCPEPYSRSDDCLCSQPSDPVDYKMGMVSGECATIGANERRPAVVLMPIFAVDDADTNKQLHKVDRHTPEKLRELNHRIINKFNKSQETTSPANEQNKQALREKIKGRVEKVRDRYFKNYFVIDPGARLPDGGPVDADTFALSRFKPEIMKPIIGRRGEELKITKKRQRHTVKPRRDFSNMEHLVSEYLSRKHKFKSLSAADVQSLNDMRPFTTATVTPNLEHFKGLSTRESRYGIQGTPERRLEDFENKMTDINKMVRYKMRNTGGGKPGIYNNLLRPVKNIQRGELMYNIRPSFDYEQRDIVKTNILSQRNINPLHSHDYNRNNLYNRRFENDGYDNVHDKLPVVNSDYDGRQIRYGDAYRNVNSNRYNHRPNRPYFYGTNRIRHVNVDQSNYRRPLKHNGDKSRQFDRRQRGESLEARHERRYLVPDRFNRVREL